MIIAPEFHMWFGIFVTLAAVYSFAKEKISLEMTALSLVAVLLIYGQIFPLFDAAGQNQLNPTSLLAGFANPSLLAILALLIMGQGMFSTEALRPITRLFMVKNEFWARLAVFAIIFFVLAASAMMNNTQLVILAIPLLQSVCVNANIPQSRVMIPLSFGAILGGMTTLIGSSTNLLVSSAMTDLGYEPLGFFDFTIPGMMMAAVGFFYIALILPRFLPDRSSLANRLTGQDKQFIAELDIDADSKLVGVECINGLFKGLEDMNVRMIQRSGHVILPPFEGYSLQSSDIVIVAATRQALTDALANHPGFLLSEDLDGSIKSLGEEDQPLTKDEEENHNTRILAEIMITPTSRLIDMSMEQAGFDKQFGAVVFGIQRRARVVRRRLGRVRFEYGDFLLIAASQASI
jgi:di/tricarboxylate transporter